MLINTSILLVLTILFGFASSEACSCRPCRRYNSYVQRCRCCTYHLVGGKRSSGYPEFLSSMTGAADHLRNKVDDTINDNIDDNNDDGVQIVEEEVKLHDDDKENNDENIDNVLDLYSKMENFFQGHPEIFGRHQKMASFNSPRIPTNDFKIFDYETPSHLRRVQSGVNDRMGSMEINPRVSKISPNAISKSLSNPSVTVNREFDTHVSCAEDVSSCNLILLKLLQS